MEDDLIHILEAEVKRVSESEQAKAEAKQKGPLGQMDPLAKEWKNGRIIEVNDPREIAASERGTRLIPERTFTQECKHLKFKELDKIKTGSRLVFLQSCRRCHRVRSITVQRNFDSLRVYDTIQYRWIDPNNET